MTKQGDWPASWPAREADQADLRPESASSVQEQEDDTYTLYHRGLDLLGRGSAAAAPRVSTSYPASVTRMVCSQLSPKS